MPQRYHTDTSQPVEVAAVLVLVQPPMPSPCRTKWQPPSPRTTPACWQQQAHPTVVVRTLPMAMKCPWPEDVEQQQRSPTKQTHTRTQRPLLFCQTLKEIRTKLPVLLPLMPPPNTRTPPTTHPTNHHTHTNNCRCPHSPFPPVPGHRNNQLNCSITSTLRLLVCTHSVVPAVVQIQGTICWLMPCTVLTALYDSICLGLSSSGLDPPPWM
jgi:hypothetical protein